MPNSDIINLTTNDFYYLYGYEISDDEEIAAGDPPFYIAPGTTRDQLTYRWQKSTDN